MPKNKIDNVVLEQQYTEYTREWYRTNELVHYRKKEQGGDYIPRSLS